MRPDEELTGKTTTRKPTEGRTEGENIMTSSVNTTRPKDQGLTTNVRGRETEAELYKEEHRAHSFAEDQMLQN
jgi:hypothetical protein